MLLDLYDSLCICKGSCIDISVFDVHAMIRYCLMKMNELVYSTVYINNNLHCTCLLLLPSVIQHDCQFQHWLRVRTHHQAIFRARCCLRFEMLSLFLLLGRGQKQAETCHVHGSCVKRGSGGPQVPRFDPHPFG
jgi:hypothetical protein